MWQTDYRAQQPSGDDNTETGDHERDGSTDTPETSTAAGVTKPETSTAADTADASDPSDASSGWSSSSACEEARWPRGVIAWPRAHGRQGVKKAGAARACEAGGWLASGCGWEKTSEVGRGAEASRLLSSSALAPDVEVPPSSSSLHPTCTPPSAAQVPGST